MKMHYCSYNDPFHMFNRLIKDLRRDQRTDYGSPPDFFSEYYYETIKDICKDNYYHTTELLSEIEDDWKETDYETFMSSLYDDLIEFDIDEEDVEEERKSDVERYFLISEIIRCYNEQPLIK